MHECFSLMQLLDFESSVLRHTLFAFVFLLFVSDKEKVFQHEGVLGGEGGRTGQDTFFFHNWLIIWLN